MENDGVGSADIFKIISEGDTSILNSAFSIFNYHQGGDCMIQKPMDVLEFHEVRKTKQQKTEFLLAAMSYAQSQRYSSKIEEGSFGCRNLVIGDPRRAKILLTAHYDTPARMWLPNFITPRCLPLYILYQLLLIAIPVGLGILAGNFVFFLTNMLPLSKILGYLVGMGLYLSLILGPANRHNANDNTSRNTDEHHQQIIKSED